MNKKELLALIKAMINKYEKLKRDDGLIECPLCAKFRYILYGITKCSLCILGPTPAGCRDMITFREVEVDIWNYASEVRLHYWKLVHSYLYKLNSNNVIFANLDILRNKLKYIDILVAETYLYHRTSVKELKEKLKFL